MPAPNVSTVSVGGATVFYNTDTGAAIGVVGSSDSFSSYDYSTYYERIATALETIATNSTSIKNSISAIETDIETMKGDITRLRDLADRTRDGLGIRTVQPYGELGIAILWLLYLEKGKITETDLASEAQLATHVARLNTILARLRANVSAEGSF